MKNQYLTLKDVLENGPIHFEGLDIDTTVEMVVLKVGSNYSIESSSFGENPIYAQTAFGHQVKLDLSGNGAFKKRLEKALEDKALEIAMAAEEYKFETAKEAM